MYMVQKGKMQENGRGLKSKEESEILGYQNERKQLYVLCNCTFYAIALLHQDLENRHSVSLQYIKETSYSEDEFLNWKMRIEKGTKSSFVLRRGSDRKGAVALYWIKGSSRKWNSFAQNHVNKIQELTNQDSWYYCPTKTNPVDLLTFGVTVASLMNSDKCLLCEMKEVYAVYLDWNLNSCFGSPSAMLQCHCCDSTSAKQLTDGCSEAYKLNKKIWKNTVWSIM
ncbi:hypothetical protein HNY73_005801 [Argiope bruennichi]|uniref:Uncharacterized protein n=1 Tax=Argiope bruennichi TaxID=94029 RepID=A0A8T0FIM9_ARGBR|nr:hypothetical protein HNY73_005801 [Argiope bruennichi]